MPTLPRSRQIWLQVLRYRLHKRNLIMQNRSITLLLVAMMPFMALAKAESCSKSEKSEISTSYIEFSRASRAGDLSKVKALSTKAIAQEITDFEKNVKDQSALARQMGGFSPALEDAQDITCEKSGDKFRLILKSTTKSEDKSKVVAQVFSVTMFEKVGSKWFVGIKASTNPFQTQPLASLLKHDQLQLP